MRGEGVIEDGRHSSPWTHPNEAPLWGCPTLAHLTGRKGGLRRRPPIPEAELAQIAEETSQTERRAAEAERELVEWKKVRFMEDRVGEEFAALVLNPAKYGLFVELTDLFVEGLVPIDSLRDDRYTWRENTHEIIGERKGRRFRAGDRVQVILDRILAQERRLQFSIVEEGFPHGQARSKAFAEIEEEPAQRCPHPFRKRQDEIRAEGQAALRAYVHFVLVSGLFFGQVADDGEFVALPLTALRTQISQTTNHASQMSRVSR